MTSFFERSLTSAGWLSVCASDIRLGKTGEYSTASDTQWGKSLHPHHSFYYAAMYRIEPNFLRHEKYSYSMQYC